MAKSYNQKAKVLYLERILQKTNEQCTVTMQEILDQLAQYEISAERKSIYDDIEALRSFGMDIQYKRGKPGGYYLVGNMIPESPETLESPELQGAVETEETESPSGEKNWEFSGKDPESEKKMMKILCSNEIRLDVLHYFGEQGQCKEKGEDAFLLTTPMLESPGFYGWLTAMGRKAHILKPKKCAQAYREYLKMLAKGYKEI